MLCEGDTEVADTGAVGGSHKNVVRLAADQVTQRAVGTGTGAGEVQLSIADCFHSIADCICAGGPVHLSSASATHQLAGHIRDRTWLWRGKQKNISHC